MEELIIKISKVTDGPGYFYDIYLSSEDMENDNCLDGGICVTTLPNTLDIATKTTKSLIKKK